MSIEKTILDKAKESYERYFKDKPDIPEEAINGAVTYDKDEMNKIIKKKSEQLEVHMANLQALKSEIEQQATMNLNTTFSNDTIEYTKTAVNQMLVDYEEERKRINELEKRLDSLKN